MRNVLSLGYFADEVRCALQKQKHAAALLFPP